MSEYLREFIPILILLIVAGGFSVVLLLVAKIFAPSSPDTEKVSTYECGFNAFEDSRMKFDVRFYLVSSCSNLAQA